jgi:excisionase family DNA binding protein
MEKICIVKLRRKIGTPAKPEEKGEPGTSREPEVRPKDSRSADSKAGNAPLPETERNASRETIEQSVPPGERREGVEQAISITLTPEQARALRSNRRLMPFLGGEFMQEGEGTDARGEPIVFRFEFEQMPPPRFLKADEVLLMLRISRNLLDALVRKGKLKAYRIGRLRRFLLDDILSCMEDNRNPVDSREKP